VVRGQLPAGHYDFGNPDATQDSLRGYAFERVAASNVVFDLDELSLHVANSIFENCCFRQQAMRRRDPPPQGNLGRRPTTYRRCAFEQVQFHVGPGFSVGHARLKSAGFITAASCLTSPSVPTTSTATSRGTSMRPCSTAVTPTGVIAAESATSSEATTFTDARLVDVGFRCGIDTTAQRWPDGYQPVTDMT
jgi:hypothetical protein